jgi:hypothetical protein
MRYTGAEDSYQRRLAHYSGIEDALKKETVYTIDGRNLNIKEIEARLEGDQYTLDAQKDL